MADALLRTDRWLAVMLALSIVLLIAVHAFERFGGYPPCELCLHQREAWWAAATVSTLGLLATRLSPSTAWMACGLLALICAVGTVLAAYHAGVEWKWWPGPAACTGHSTHAVTGADVAAALTGATKVHLVRCDDAAVRWFGVSMAGWNALISLAAALGSALAATRGRVRA